jgi:cystathionine beta-lyase/cystathionine gamma-synthase
MSPYLQRPLEFGVDIVVHSTTKYLNGHSDGVGGVVVLNDEEDANWIGFVQNSAGAILSPFDSWLVLRGTKTLALRMEQHDKTGPRGRRIFGRASEGEKSLLPAPRRTRSPRPGAPPATRFWWHGVV